MTTQPFIAPDIAVSSNAPGARRFGAPIASYLSAFVDVADGLVARISGERRWIAVEREDGTFAILDRRRGKARPFGTSQSITERQRAMLAKSSGRPVELRLLADRLIVATVKVPVGALGYVDKIIEHRIERLTPWRLDQLVYGYDISSRPGVDGQHEASLTATSKDIAADAVKRMEPTGLTPTILGSAAEPVDTATRIDLFRGRANTGRQTRRRIIARGAIVLLFAAILAFGASVWWSAAANRDLTEADQSLSALRNRLSVAAKVGTNDQQALLLREKSPETAVFVLINRLAAEIPADTYLSSLEIQPLQVHLSGNSGNASGLFDILETRLGFTDPAFEAPVTRLAGGRDQFSIVATRKPAAEAAQ